MIDELAEAQKRTDAFWADPEAARRHLAKIYHPDKNPPDMHELCTEIMKDINESVDAELRRRGLKR